MGIQSFITSIFGGGDRSPSPPTSTPGRSFDDDMSRLDRVAEKRREDRSRGAPSPSPAPTFVSRTPSQPSPSAPDSPPSVPSAPSPRRSAPTPPPSSGPRPSPRPDPSPEPQDRGGSSALDFAKDHFARSGGGDSDSERDRSRSGGRSRPDPAPDPDLDGVLLHPSGPVIRDARNGGGGDRGRDDGRGAVGGTSGSGSAPDFDRTPALAPAPFDPAPPVTPAERARLASRADALGKQARDVAQRVLDGLRPDGVGAMNPLEQGLLSLSLAVGGFATTFAEGARDGAGSGTTTGLWTGSETSAATGRWNATAPPPGPGRWRRRTRPRRRYASCRPLPAPWSSARR